MDKSAGTVASIEDLLIQILLRLPIRSLLRFEAVSKRWLSIITDLKFRRQRSTKPSPAVGLFYKGQHPPGCNEDKDDENKDTNLQAHNYISFSPHESVNGPTVNLNFTKEPSRSLVKDSCNGLFLCCGYWNDSSGWNSKRKFYVYNPTTNKSYAVPDCDKSSSSLDWLALAYDPIESPHYHVIGVESVYDSGPVRFRFLIYSSESRAWAVACKTNKSSCFLKPVYWNGSVHWISIFSDVPSALRFIVDQQEVVEFPIPPFRAKLLMRDDYYLGQSCGHLNFIDKNSRVFDVYEMKRDYTEWCVKYQVDISPIADDYPSILPDEMYDEDYWWYNILCMVRNEEDGEDKSFLVLGVPGYAIKFHLVNRTFERIYTFTGYYGRVNISTEGYQFIESLCSVE